jgi:sugar phosphate permease
LPTLLWIVVIGGGVLILLSVAAITIVDRPWPQCGLLAALAALILGVILLIAALDRPFANGQVAVSEGPMKSALVAVSQHVQQPFCSRFDASGKLLTRG